MKQKNVWTSVGVLVLVAAATASGSVGTREITQAEQQAFLGSGPDYGCIGTYACTACVPPAGCKALGIFGYVACTFNGTDGCMQAGQGTVCAPLVNGACMEDADSSCGGSGAPRVYTMWDPETGEFYILMEVCEQSSASGYCDGCY